MRKKTKRNIWYTALVIIEILCILALSFLIFVLFKNGTNINQINQKPADQKEQSSDKTNFLKDEEGIIIIEETNQENNNSAEVVIPINKVLFEYIEVFDGCGAHFEGECLNVRSGPGEEYPSVAKLRNGIVLKVDGEVEREDGEIWYKVAFDEWLRYPERIKGDWYVNSDYVEVLLDEGDKPSGITVKLLVQKKLS